MSNQQQKCVNRELGKMIFDSEISASLSLLLFLNRTIEIIAALFSVEKPVISTELPRICKISLYLPKFEFFPAIFVSLGEGRLLL